LKKATTKQDLAFPIKRPRGRPRKILPQPTPIIEANEPNSKIFLSLEV